MLLKLLLRMFRLTLCVAEFVCSVFLVIRAFLPIPVLIYPSIIANSMKDKIIIVLKLIGKVIPYLVALLTGAGISAVAGCKCGSLISIVP